MKPRNIDDCIRRYGPVSANPEGGILWKAAPDWVKPFPVPDQIVMRNIFGKPVYRIFCNIDIHKSLDLAFKNLIMSGTHMELNTFDGCFNVRWVRGMPGVPSYHCWGIALDFNAKENPLGSKGKWSENFLLAWELAGFEWGGNFKSRPDPMHWQWVLG